MPAIPLDYQADILRVDLRKMGCTRIILLGQETEMASGGLRTSLAKWGLQVLVPPEGERPWIAGLADRQADGADSADVDRLRALLTHGVEHGVGAIVVTSEQLAAAVDACRLPVPTLAFDPRGRVVPIQNVVFDMGGVLFRWEPIAMSRRVCDTDEDARLLSQAVFDSQEWVWQDAGAVDEETVAWASKTRVPRRLHAAVDELVFHWHDHRVHVAGIEELVCDLKDAGYGIYLLSNAGESFARYEAQLPARACFDGMVVSCYEHVVKPDARIYRTLLERFGLKAGECLFVDDTPRNVLGARRVGMRAYHFTEDVQSLRAALLG